METPPGAIFADYLHSGSNVLAYWKHKCVSGRHLPLLSGLCCATWVERLGGHVNERIDIFDSILDLALLGVRRLREKRLMRKRLPARFLLPALGVALSKEGRPGFLLLVDISRTLLRRGPLTITDIADVVGRPLSTASRMVDALESAGMVSRVVNPDDARSRLVELTAEGVSVVQDLRTEAAMPFLERLERLSPAETETLRSLLEKLTGPDSGAARDGWRAGAGADEMED